MGDDELGKSGWDRLKDTQGKEFRKQKNKLKNKSSYVGTLTMADNTIAFD
jgi:NADPH-dependent curcumin reductase CurA